MAHAGEDGSASYVNKGLRTQLSTKKFTNELFDRNRKDWTKVHYRNFVPP